MTTKPPTVKERPIIFTGESVRAILHGRKTQTRRVVKAKHLPFIENLLGGYLDGKWNQRPLPFQPGQGLWIRETWMPDGADSRFEAMKQGLLQPDIIYKATTERDLRGFKWRSPMFMPRWASRLTLAVTGVRVQRLHHINGADIQGEGWDDNADECVNHFYEVRDPFIRDKPLVWFQDHWDAINAKRGHPWESDPWVWVITFSLVKRGAAEGVSQ